MFFSKRQSNEQEPSEDLKIPTHIAMIMDGNGRWAQKRGGIRLNGHKAGAETVRRVLRLCKKYGVRYLTLYAFSTENWSRPTDEVNGLMSLLSIFLRDNEQELINEKLRFRTIGRRADLPPKLQEQIAKVEESTKGFERELIVALSYGGRAEITDATKAIAEDVAYGKIKPNEITEGLVSSYLYAPDVPDPDLIVRTSGELRLSNFLLWEAAYSELYVTDTLWPDFQEEDFVKALEAFSKRKRRYGGTENK